MSRQFKKIAAGFALAGFLLTGALAGVGYSQARASTTTGTVTIRQIVAGSLSFATGISETFKIAEPTPATPVAALVTDGTGNVTAGAHTFKVVYNTATGHTAASVASNSVTADGTHTKITVTLPTGDGLVTSRDVCANAYIDGFIENPSGAATNINVMVKTSNASDLVTVYRDSWCRAF